MSPVPSVAARSVLLASATKVVTTFLAGSQSEMVQLDTLRAYAMCRATVASTSSSSKLDEMAVLVSKRIPNSRSCCCCISNRRAFSTNGAAWLAKTQSSRASSRVNGVPSTLLVACSTPTHRLPTTMGAKTVSRNPAACASSLRSTSSSNSSLCGSFRIRYSRSCSN